MDIRKLQRAIVNGLEDVKAQDIKVFNTEHLSSLFERVIVASGASNRQTKALATSVREAVKAAGFGVPRTEGEDNGEWIIVDCAQAVVHVMQPAIRDYYRLEEIWGGKPVRMKLGGGQTTLPKASEGEDADDDGVVVNAPQRKTRVRKTPAPVATASSAAGQAALGGARLAAEAPAVAVKKPAAPRKVSSGTASGEATPRKTPARKTSSGSASAPAAKKTTRTPKAAAPIKTIVVKPAAKKTSARSPAAAKKPSR